MANRKTLEQARRQARERLAKAQRERAEREGRSVDDAAEVMRALARVAEVDEWLSERIAAVVAEADRRRSEHHKAAASAIAQMRARGDAIQTIALLADIPESQVRKYLRSNGDSRAAATHGSSSDSQCQAAPTAALLSGVDEAGSNCEGPPQAGDAVSGAAVAAACSGLDG